MAAPRTVIQVGGVEAEPITAPTPVPVPTTVPVPIQTTATASVYVPVSVPPTTLDDRLTVSEEKSEVLPRIEAEAAVQAEPFVGPRLAEFGFVQDMETARKSELVKQEAIKTYKQGAQQVADAEAKSKSPDWVVDQAALDEAKASQAEYKDWLLKVTDPELAPYLSMAKDRKGAYEVKVDIVGAIRDGVSEAKLTDLGYLTTDIGAARQHVAKRREFLEAIPERAEAKRVFGPPLATYTKEGSVDVVGYLTDNPGDIETLVGYGYAEADLQRISGAVESLRKADALTDPARYLVENPGSEGVLKDLGFTSAQLSSIRTDANKVREFEAKNTQLPDGAWMANSDLAGIKSETPGAYAILMSEGYKGYEKAYQDANVAVKPYIDKAGNIDMVAAVSAQVPDKTLRLLFKQEDLDLAHDTVDPYIPMFDRVEELKGQLEKIGDSRSFTDAIRVDHIRRELETLNLSLTVSPLGVSRAMSALAEARTALTKVAKDWPAGISLPTRFLIGMGFGAFVEAPIYGVAFAITALSIPFAKDPKMMASQVGTGIVEYLKTIPAQVAIDPAFTAGELLGLFVLGPKGVLKMARATAARTSPWFVPSTAMRFSFSVGKLPLTKGVVLEALRTGKITETSIARAMARVQDRALKNPKGIAQTRIGRSNIRIHVEPTPAGKRMGGVLWHASPDASSYRGLKFVVEAGGPEGALFTSIHAAPRFAMMSASGKGMVTPCLVMIYTRKGGLQWYPSSIQYARVLSEMRAKGFEYLGSGRAKPGAYGPIKTYAGTFELEALLPNGMKLARVKNLKSRLLGPAAGEFVTVQDGWVLPIYRFAERGAKVPQVNIAALAAIRVEAIWHGLKRLMGKKGLQARGFTIEGLTKEFTKAGEKAAEGKTGAVATRAYNTAVERASRTAVQRLYDAAGKRGEVLWKRSPQIFEIAFRERITRGIARAYNVPIPRMRPPTRRVVFSRPMVARQGRMVREPVASAARANVARDVARSRSDVPRIMRTSREPEPPRRTPPPSVPYVPRPPRLEERVPPRKPPPRREPPVREPPRRVPPTTPPPKKPPPTSIQKVEGDGRRFIKKGAVAWRQGTVTKKGKRVPVWWVVNPPYKSRGDVLMLFQPPSGAKTVTGPQSAYRTIQLLSGRPPSQEITLDLGMQDIIISRPIRKPGRKGAIIFRRDPKRKTRSQIVLAGTR